MKLRTSFLKRCLALVMALVLLVSGSNLGVALTVFAGSASETITDGKLIANNYDLSDAEKALLSSGLLAESSYSYNVPAAEDGLVEVDTEAKTITAKDYQDWVPTGAKIVVGEEVKEEVVLTDGKGTYAYAENAFSVVVDYSLSLEVDADAQQTLLNTIGWLKDGVANADTVNAQSGNLFVLEEAMPQLVELAGTGIDTSIGNVGLSADGVAAINRLNGQMTKNDGQLDLSVMVEDYDASASKVEYVLTQGKTMKAEVDAITSDVSNISTALTTLVDNLQILIQLGYVSEEQANQLRTLNGVVSNLKNNLSGVAEAEWTAADEGTVLVKTDISAAGYLTLDGLVAGLETVTVVSEIKNPLLADTESVRTNMSMWNVGVTVKLNVVVENEVVEYGTKSATMVLTDGSTAEQILAAIAENGIEAAALAEWADVYVEEHFDVTTTELPDVLSEDIDYVITYAPKNYTITINGVAAEYPYDYQLTLPVHEDPEKSYDYEDADGNYYAQGTVITVTGDLTLNRTEGKAYTNGKLLAIIADNYGTDKVTAILTSGALKIDEPVDYREPSKEQLEELVKLSGNVLTVKSYDSSYKGLSWAPYSYVVDGNEKLFNGATEVTIAGDFETVNVYYRLTLSNYTKADVKEILDLVATLVDEAEGQKSVMDKLAGYESYMGQLTKNMLNGLNGVIGGYSTENGGGLNPDPVKNDELVAYFQETIGNLVKECTEGQYLKLYNIILAYNDENNGGLTYYYQNHETVRGEVDVLSGYLNDMLDGGDRQTALEKLMSDNGYADKVDVLETLGDKLAEVSAELKPVNDAINTEDSAKLSALAKALSMEGSVEVAAYDSPYVQMGPVIRTADKYVTVEVKVTAGGKTNTDPISVTILKGNALTQAQVNDLKSKVNAFVSTAIDAPYYTSDYEGGAELDALVGKVLNESATYNYTWTAKTYTVKIAGEADQYISVENLTVTLPAHPQAGNGMSYEYTVGDKTATSGIYTFTKAELDTLFVNGVYTITRIEKNEAVEKLVQMVNTINTNMGFEALTLVQENGVYTGIAANIGLNDMMDFVMGLVLDSGYGYIGLNDEGLVYENDKAELEISIQTLINAILNDEEFNNDVVIALSQNGKGELFSASMQLGNSATELAYSDLDFTMNLSSVPAQLTNNADLVKTVSNYIKFQSNNGELDVSVNLPDKVYGAYAAALIATGNVDKTDVNTLTQKVAIQFVYDYLTAITGSEADLVSFTNTMKMLGLSQDLTGYNKYYDPAVSAYNSYVTVDISDDGAAIDMSAPGKASIDALLKLAGIGTEGMATYLNMVKEYKADATIDASINGTLKNTDKTYYALIVDAQADGVTNKIEAPSSIAALQNETKSLAGYSAMILLDDVTDDLTISGTTVLDLNGKSVSGNINATGTLYIIDSSMDTYNAGSVGSVSGNAVIIGGNYNSDVSSFLKDGYYMDGTTVRNALYYITDDEGTVTFNINGDVYQDEHVSGYIPNAQALAVDIAADLVLNYIYTAKLSVEGHDLIGIDVDDLVGIYDDRDATGLAKALIDCVTVGEAGYENNVGFEAVVNLILDDVIDFAAISDALTNNTALATYAVTTQPWTIELEHNADEDYVTVNVGSNADLEKTFNIALVVESKFNDNLAALAGELANIVEDRTDIEVDIPTPTYSDKKLTVTGNGKAEAYVDMSGNSDYATMIGVILAYGNADKREAVAAAVNAGDMDALKAVVDATSVEEIFTALKVMSRNVDFAAMAEAVGVTVDVTSAAELEAIYHVVLCGVGKVLEELEITGMNSKLGNLYNDETGYYELTKEDIFRDKELTARGYTALIEVTADILSLNVKLFGEDDCLWGDANHDGKVNGGDATLILQYELGIAPDDFCTKRTDVNGDGKINGGDATLILQYELGAITEFPAETKDNN